MHRQDDQHPSRPPTNGEESSPLVDELPAGDQVPYRELIENTSEGVIIAQDETICFANAAVAEMIGRQAEEMYYLAIEQFIHPADQEMIVDRHKRRLRGEKLLERYPLRVLHKDGSLRWLDSKVVVINWRGRPAAMSFFTDITDRKLAEDELAVSEKRYRALSDATFEAIFISENGYCVETNLAATRMFGYQRDEFIGLHAAEIVTPEFRETVVQHIRDNYEEPYEVMAQRKDGTTFPVMIRGRMTSYQGRPVRVAVIRDMTEEKNAYAELAGSERTLNSIFRAAPIGIGLTDGNFIKQANDRLCEMLGYGLDDLLHKPVEMLFSDGRTYEKAKQEILRQTKTQGSVAVETQWRRKDGRVIDAFLNTTTIDSRDLAAGITFTAFDITARKQMERDLRKERDRTQRYLDTAEVVLLVLDTQGRVKLVNRKGCDVLGYSEEELIAADWFDKCLPREVSDDLRRYFKGITSGEATAVGYHENPVITKDGQERIVRWYNTVLFDENGAISGVLSSGEDITAQKSAEKERQALEAQLRQSQKMEAIGTLAGGIAHDFNNILGAVMGYGELAHDKGRAGGDNTEEIKKIIQAAERARNLVKQILTFSRTMETNTKLISLNQEVERTTDMLRHTLPKMIELELDLSRDLWDINCDPGQVEQMLLNLASNAADAMPDGGRLAFQTANLKVAPRAAGGHLELLPGRYVRLSISDTGHGMDGATLERIFDPFFTTKEVDRGTGLGLSMVYGIIKKHGGYIHCESQVGRGTKFILYFPADSRPQLNLRGAAQSASQDPMGGGETILLVDDEIAIRDVGKQLLSSMGYRVLVAESGEEGLRLFSSRRREIDLVIMDLSMPGMGGAKSIKAMIEVDPSVKVLVASGYADTDKIKEVLTLGASGFIGKPFLKTDLDHTIRKVIDG